ncbi:MAG: hypothetical protein KAF91_03135 [Nostoc sp. TH1S01]|nr:hypothetical protein [Nostoc sp. TH1S01]
MTRLISNAVATSGNCLKTMPKDIILAIACFPLLLSETVFIPTASALDGKELYQLCSSFPLNSQCKDYEVPIPLDNRSGKKADCIFKNNEKETRGICKIDVTEKGITIYQETGKKLEIINDKKSTRTIQIQPTSVSKIEYREDEKANVEGKIVNTILFGVAGLLFTPNQKISEIQINYTLTTSQDTSQEQQNVDSLRIFVGRGTGREMRSQLEKITGLRAEII